jgi:perosamine synthetase
MPNLFQAIPPVTAPVDPGRVWKAWAGRAPVAESVQHARESLRKILDGGEFRFFSSGRSAMVAVLRAMHRLTGRSEVIIPAYNCFTVPSSVGAAGLKVVPCDLRYEDLGMDLNALEATLSSKTLCVIPAHLFGIPSNVSEAAQLARSRNAWVLEDAAQSFGALIDGKPAGTLGDAGLFSLGRGKNVTTLHGGILRVANPALLESLDKVLREDNAESKEFTGGIPVKKGGDLRTVIELMLLPWLSRPPVYGFLSRIPSLEVGASRFDANISVGYMTRFQLGLLATLAEDVEQVRQSREALALDWAALPWDTTRVRIPEPVTKGSGAWLRYPVIMQPNIREKLFDSGGELLGLSASYPFAVPGIPGVEPHLLLKAPCPVAERIACGIVTLPTHPGVTPAIRKAIVKALRKVGALREG